MDDACADAQVALGAVLFWSEWDWAGAKRSLERALEINPNHTEAYLLYGQLLEAQGSLEEGLAMKLRALERDPFSPLVHLQISMSYFLSAGMTTRSSGRTKLWSLTPGTRTPASTWPALTGKRAISTGYMAENIKHAELHGAPAAALEPLKQAYAAGGRAGVRAFFLQRASSQPQAFPAMQLAIVYGEAGDMDAAFLHLDRALESHDPGLVHLAVGPQWDSLRADPRYTAALRKMNLA